MACWSSTGMSFKTKRHGSSPKVESRCSATHFRCMREVGRASRLPDWSSFRLATTEDRIVPTSSRSNVLDLSWSPGFRVVLKDRRPGFQPAMIHLQIEAFIHRRWLTQPDNNLSAGHGQTFSGTEVERNAAPAPRIDLELEGRKSFRA